MNQDPLFELTASPYLNDLILKTKDLYSGCITDSQYKESVKSLNEFRRSFRSFLREQLKFTPSTELVKKESESLEKSLEKLRISLETIYKYFSDGKKEHIEEGLYSCREVFDAITLSIEKIQQQDALEDKYCDAPLQNELMRIGFALIDNKITPAAFSVKVDALLKSLREYSSRYDPANLSSAERSLIESDGIDLKKLLKDYVKALEMAKQYLYDGDRNKMIRGLEESKKVAEQLFVFQEKLNEIQQFRMCIKCGARNPASEKMCVECSAVLPVVLDETQTMGFKQNENGEISAGRIESELARDVSRSVSRVREGSLSRKEFSSFIKDIINKVQTARKEKEKLPIPEPLKGKEESSPLFLQIEELIQTGFEDMLEGLEKMSLYAVSESESQLIFGLEEFLSGSDRLLQAQKLISQASKAR